MPEVTEGLKMSINLLKSTFAKNPKKLADWGIEVDDTPKAKKPPKAQKAKANRKLIAYNKRGCRT